MKKLFLIVYCLLLIANCLFSQNIGIGTTAPSSKLHVSNGAVLFNGTAGATPVSGGGTRFMWVPEKAALRAGQAIDFSWDDGSIGFGSVAMGTGTVAIGYASTAFGQNNSASGTHSFAAGNQCTAFGAFSISMGDDNITLANNSVALGEGNYIGASASLSFAAGGSNNVLAPFSIGMGFFNNPSKIGSVAIGYSNSASGNYSTVFGSNNMAMGDYSTAMGATTVAYGMYSAAIGNGAQANDYGGFAIGHYNDNSPGGNASSIAGTNRLFEIGNGATASTRSNAMTVLQNGNVGIGILTPSQKLEVNGNITVQNGKGIIRSSDGTQQKKLTSTVTINTSFNAGETKTFAVTWPESFGGTPDAFIGNMTTGTGGWAEIVLTVTTVTTTGATLYAYNPRSVSASPNYTMKIIAIGPQ